MLKNRFCLTFFILSGILLLVSNDLSAAVSEDLIKKTDASIDSLRKRKCSITFSIDGQPLSEKGVKITQLHNDFGFGGTVHKVGLTSGDSAYYADAFCRFFDWAVPENEMKWPYTEKAPDTVSYTDADFLVDWCLEHDIKVRGHNLFWNEDIKWLPEWTLSLNATQFRAAMEKRITDIMTHFKGRVAHWDVINELIHYPQATHGTPEVTLFDSITGDPNIFRWILKKARSIDPNVKFTVNEYAILEDLDATPSTFSVFKDKMNRLLTDSTSFDIVGLEGHFGDWIDQSRYSKNLDSVTKAIPRQIWLTEVDFSVAEDIPDRIEELMRTAFAHRNVGGLVLWSWWEGRKWRTEITSTLADGIVIETDAGIRWLELRDKWKTKLDATTDGSGKYDFRGFHGEYLAEYKDGDKTYSSRFYLQPQLSDTTINLTLKNQANSSIRKSQRAITAPVTLVYLNGQAIRLNCHVPINEQMYLSTYSVNGRLLCKTPIDHLRKVSLQPSVSLGCCVVRIGTDKKTFYSGRLINIK